MRKGAAVAGGARGIDIVFGRDTANVPATGAPIGTAVVADVAESTLPTMAPLGILPVFNPAGWGTAIVGPAPPQPRTSTSKSKSATPTINPLAATAAPSMDLPNPGSTGTTSSIPSSTSSPSLPSASPTHNTLPPGVTAAIALGVVIILIAGISGFLWRRTRRRQHRRQSVHQLRSHHERSDHAAPPTKSSTGNWVYEKKLVAEMESPHPASGKQSHASLKVDGKEEGTEGTEGWRWSSGRQRWSKGMGRDRHELDAGWGPQEMQGVRF
ncbi:MAG: hypothetical protein LQ346_005941 [Caloplaca aetnensis]|nr:MAG: hypothetical protein LQ346_005941 [Caloplaca aetnensis]